MIIAYINACECTLKYTERADAQRDAGDPAGLDFVALFFFIIPLLFVILVLVIFLFVLVINVLAIVVCGFEARCFEARCFSWRWPRSRVLEKLPVRG